MIELKSLAALKRFIKPGQRWDCIQPETGWCPGIREVDHVNSVGIGFKTAKGVSYLEWPKASELLFIHDPLLPDQVRFRVNPEEAPHLYLIYTLKSRIYGGITS